MRQRALSVIVEKGGGIGAGVEFYVGLRRSTADLLSTTLAPDMIC
jgi:hypothetical protein